MTPQSEYIEAGGIYAVINRTKRRKTATIKVEDGEVVVVVPSLLSDERITKLIIDKQQWIHSKLSLNGDIQPQSSKQYVSGEAFSYLGRNYRLKISVGEYEPIKLSHGRFIVTLPEGKETPQFIKSLIVSWYIKHARIKLTEKSNRYAKLLDVNPRSIDIKSYKSRWGSCSIDGDIDYNWLIVMAPNRIVDYVVIHELCHLKHHDHSPKFWRQVERVMPNYAECKEWLKVNGGSLEF